MRTEEARWIAARLAALDAVSPLIELGSADARYRRVTQPHIEALIHAPLRARGVRIVHVDAKQADGVDIAGDVFDPGMQTRLAALGARCVLCCNMFEHVPDPAALAAICDAVLMPGGYLIATVPRSYPFHADPIDTYFRPTPDEIVALFPGYASVDGAIIESDSFLGELRKRPALLGGALRSIAASAVLYRGWTASKRRVHRFAWALRPYRVSAVVLRKG